MLASSDFPFRTEIDDDVRISMRDGTHLAARIWRPVGSERTPVPAILEYLPYRRRDGTAERDALTHPYFAGHGYACVRVDMRGSGDSEGVLLGEYLRQEQEDGLDIIAWLSAQPWCSGNVGMIGISWGGFNGLQMAALRPAALKAVVSVCSTDDRYADDIHFMGGCLLLDKLTWGSTMFSLNTAPPDPEVVGPAWRDMWMRRLEESGLWLETWLSRQRRDEFYTHGSICEDWSAIECPVFAVGGWADGYTNSIFRLLANLKGPRRALIGPWGHKYPHFANPGPQIGFLQECLRWWDKWLKGIETDVMEEPMLRAWMEEPARPKPHYDEKPGRWIAEADWPAGHIAPVRMRLSPGRLAEPGEESSPRAVSISSPQTTGLFAGKWCPYGMWPDQPLDQRAEMGGQAIFDSDPLPSAVEILGIPVVTLDIAADRPNGIVAVTLCEVFPDGAATRITYGLLNLTHRDSHAHPEALEPGRRYRVTISLNAIAHRFGHGNRLRVALSTAYWPLVWPSPEAVTLTVFCDASELSLPVRAPQALDRSLGPLPQAQSAPQLAQQVLQRGGSSWNANLDVFTGETTVRRVADDGIRLIEGIGLEVGFRSEHDYTIKADDPLSARLETRYRRHYRRGEWKVASETRIVLTSTASHFHLAAKLVASEGDEPVASKEWTAEIPRDLV
ncbi:MAG: CocE/NonD family hydrolase [Pseudomonadota bacterium]|nr:CocE/NonD family hydrolase [Pseudomonadota bacterium]